MAKSGSAFTIYTQYNPPPKVISPHGGKSLTDASCLDDCDMNKIIARYKAGDVSLVRGSPFYGDVSEIGDFRSCMEKVRSAQSAFAALPSEIRDRFGNDPAALVDFLKDSANDEEAVRLGLKVKKPKTIAEEVRDGVMAANAAAASAQSEAGRTTSTT